MTQDRRTWAKAPAAAIGDREVSNAQFRTLTALVMHADKRGCCRVKVETLARIRGVSRQQIQLDLFALRARGYVHVVPTARRCGGNGANEFRVFYPAVFTGENGNEDE